MKTVRCAICVLILLAWCAAAHPRQRHYRCEATAFSHYGRTDLGNHTKRGIVAADPALFPLGTVIQVSGAGRYSGSYVVTDTGSKVIGRHIDIYIPNRIRAKNFGKKIVTVRVVQWGTLSPNAAG